MTSTYGDRGQMTVLGSNTRGYFGTGNTDRLSQGSVTFDSGALGLMQRTTGSTVENFARTPAGDAVGRLASSGHAHYYYVHDHLGSVVGIFDSAGSYKGGYSYSPYGEARSTGTDTAVTSNTLRYIGEHHDGNGIYKLGARYYDANLGRFTQMDPSGQEANPYAYGGNGKNPINGRDPSGLAFYDNAYSIALLIVTLAAGPEYAIIISIVAIFGDEAYELGLSLYRNFIIGGCSYLESVVRNSTGIPAPLCR